MHDLVSIPIFCIGGINLRTLPAVIAAGARRVVIVSALLQAPDLAAFCREVRDQLGQSEARTGFRRRTQPDLPPKPVRDTFPVRMPAPLLPAGPAFLDEPAFRRTVHHAILRPALALGATALLLLALTVFLFRSANWVDHTDRVLSQAYAVEKLAVDMETGLRGYALTGDRTFLQPWNEAESRTGPALEALTGLLTDNAGQASLAAAERAHFDRWRAYAGETMDRVAAGQNAGDAAWNQRGKALFDSFRASSARLIDTEERLRSGRIHTLGLVRNAVFGTLALAALLGIPLLVRGLAKLVERVGSAYHASLAVTERQRDELQVSLRSIGDAILSTDRHGAVAFLNAVAERLTGWSDAEARGRSLAEVLPIFHEQTGEPAVNPVERVLREKIIVGLANHTVLRPRGGGEIPIEDSAAPIFADDGSVRGVILVFRDVSEKHAREMALREADSRTRIALEMANGGAWLIDAATGSASGDAMLARSLNLDEEQCALGEPMESFLSAIHEEDQPQRAHGALTHR